MKHCRILTLLITALVTLSAHAVKNYSCDFETATERARWTLNPVANQSQLDKLVHWCFG